MIPRSNRRMARLLLLVLLLSWLPGAAPQPAVAAAPSTRASALPLLAAPAIASAQGTPLTPPVPQVVPILTQPVPSILPPGLALEIAVAPDPLDVGDTATISVTVTNRAPYPAERLTITADTPAGALAEPGPFTVSPTHGWQWPVGHLDGNGATTVSGAVRLVRRPPGMALLLTVKASADGLSTPCPGHRRRAGD